ncbi:MAG: transposase [Sphingobacteriales bacterium]|nr:MAG: transposase [Sphingobacteriales bacterium]
MFKKNLTHNQSQLFGLSFYLNKDKQKRLENSSGGHFYRLVFCNIQEEDFSVLYSTKHSAPNAPINCMIAALLLMQKHSWTYAQLFEQIDFNLETRFALGLQDLEKVPFTEPTLFNFKSRLNTHFVNTGEDLIGKLFDRLTNQQLKELKLKTTIQRTDSLLLNSNIRSYSRIELLVELLLRFYSILTAEEQERYTADLSDYIGKKANEYIRHIKPGDQNTHLQKLGQVYHLLYTQLQDIYREHEAFQVFSRVYAEHFTLPETDEKTSVPAPKPNEALNSKCLQSPDDTEATYRKKKGKQYQGYVAMVTETCHPDNDLQLITDVHTATNNTDDTQLLHERLDSIKEKTPDLEQLHHDGGFGSEDNDIKLNELGITPIQTAIKGCCASSPSLLPSNPIPTRIGYNVPIHNTPK